MLDLALSVCFSNTNVNLIIFFFLPPCSLLSRKMADGGDDDFDDHRYEESDGDYEVLFFIFSLSLVFGVHSTALCTSPLRKIAFSGLCSLSAGGIFHRLHPVPPWFCFVWHVDV